MSAEVTRGIMYVAPKQYLLDEAIVSVRSLRRLHRDLSVTVFTNLEAEGYGFDHVVSPPTENGNYMDKVEAMALLPYDRTIFMDSDTFIGGQLDDVFTLLDNFDLCVAHATGRNSYNLEGVTPAYTEFNTGVIGFRRSPKVAALMEDWKKRYAAQIEEGIPMLTDQPAFRAALFFSSLRYATLTSEYNCRTPFPGFIKDSVTILHGRARSPYIVLLKRLGASREKRLDANFRALSKMIKNLNASAMDRLHFPSWNSGVSVKKWYLRRVLFRLRRYIYRKLLGRDYQFVAEKAAE